MDQVRESFQKPVTIANHRRLSNIQNGNDQTHRAKNEPYRALRAYVATRPACESRR